MVTFYFYIFGLDPVIMPFSSGTSDERFLGALGIPHVKFGARGANNHSYDEYVEVKSYHRVILFYFHCFNAPDVYTRCD
jgi:acetylornithine deacetylase/succinyl-diaminopimelate desuccinylase-like protein